MAIAKDFRFIGRLCLDFAQTGDMGWGERYERLTKPSELQRWLTQSPLQLPQIRITNRDLIAAKALRHAIWNVAQAILSKKKPVPANIRLINATALQPALVKQLDNKAQATYWQQPTLAKALAAIAADAVALFGDATQRARLRRCANSACRVIFYDDSRPGLRRWCASTRCGDRIRTRLYRARLKS